MTLEMMNVETSANEQIASRRGEAGAAESLIQNDHRPDARNAVGSRPLPLERPQMVREPKGEGNDGQRWIADAARREHGGARYKEVAETMNAAVAIDNPLSRILVHPCRSHVVRPPTEVSG